jgi:6-phosphogluconolactonase/glucosamine-6-phosphate isomerase/deaminase
MNIVSIPDKQLLTKTLCEDLAVIFEKNAGKPILHFYSGGSALEIYPLMVEFLKEKSFDFTKCMFAPVDERFEYMHSNYVAFKKLPVFEALVGLGAKFVDTGIQSGTLDEAASWYEQWVRGEMKRVKMLGGVSIAVLGMGPDGHTAGIFPYPENKEFFDATFVETNKWVAGYDVGGKNPFKKRFTLTRPSLMEIDSNFVYVCGENKQQKLQEVLQTWDLQHEVPARIWYKLKNLAVYTNQVL